MSDAPAPPYCVVMDGAVFVSFASKDRNFATMICDALEQRGIGCWIATRDIGPGENFQTAVFNAIRSAKVMVLVFSTNAHNSDEVKKEIVLAGQCRVNVIPVRVEDVTPDGAFAYELATRQWVDLFDDWERSIQRLIEQIVKVIGQQPGAAPSVAASPEVPAGIADIARGPLQHPLTVGAAASAPATTMPPTTGVSPAKKKHLAAIGGVGALAIAGIAAAWLWSGGLSRGPAPTPFVSPITAADALTKAKAALDRKEYLEAMRWYRQAADQGNTNAQTHVGYLYEKGLGVPQNYSEALSWYRKAADRGHAAAQRNIGSLYEQGTGVPQDYGEAMRWFRLAADQGNAGAQTNIGYLYEKGLGVPQNYAEAMRWYRLAADQGEATAQNNIGVFYDNGYGVTQNYGEAIGWYRLAASQGNIDAEYNLALLYADGHGVPSDLGEARRWMQKAADAGDPEAKTWLGKHNE
ncbi:MAG TPA: toll/interleukin-1 receptor domain-containing protein [Stellaceae bacterium]|nr:toll/interleukin-1 receptor domain-containing protein [Stellaceae bacterium]